jgi:hypothetical protein
MRVPLHSDRLARRQPRERPRDRVEASAVLGDRHPLVVVLGRLDSSKEQLLWVAAVHALSLVLWVVGPAGGALVAGVIAAELVLACRIVLLRMQLRGLCLDLIVEGNEDLPVAAVAAERARLVAPRHQQQLARTLERIVCPQPVSSVLLTARPVVHARVVNALAPQLHELTYRLRQQQVSCRGVALIEELICSPGSPLYGTDPDELARELGRVRYLA